MADSDLREQAQALVHGEGITTDSQLVKDIISVVAPVFEEHITHYRNQANRFRSEMLSAKALSARLRETLEKVTAEDSAIEMYAIAKEAVLNDENLLG